MARISKKVTDEVVKIAEARLKELGKDSFVAAKLQAVISVKQHGVTKVSEVYNISRPTLFSWIKHVIDGNLDRLTVAAGRGRKQKLTNEQISQIKEWVLEDSQLTINHVKILINEKFKVDISRTTTHRIIQSLDFSYITPRPRHYKQDEIKQQEFKKN